MRVLIISYVFPPFNNIGTLRVGKTAKYLSRFGHEVRVVTAADIPYPPVLKVEIPPDHVTRTTWINVDRPADLCLRPLRTCVERLLPSGFLSPYQWTEDRIRWLYRCCFNLPDFAIGWLPSCVRAASELCRTFQPDVILASAPPPTALIAAHIVSARFSIPWVSDFRDLWTDDHYRRYPWLRVFPERLLENRILASAAGLLTISHPLAEILRTRFRKPVKVILNGFDAEDVPATADAAGDSRLRLVYTGTLHLGRRDVGPLLKALATHPLLRTKVLTDYYITPGDAVVLREQARALGLTDAVRIHPWVPHEESLRLQGTADVLLLPMWNHPSEIGVFTGKLFEYVGSRRPILAITSPANVAARLIRARRLGFAGTDPAEIAAQLQRWSDQKEREGQIRDLPASSTKGLTRQDQTRNLETFLEGIVRATTSSEEYRRPGPRE